MRVGVAVRVIVGVGVAVRVIVGVGVAERGVGIRVGISDRITVNGWSERS